MKKGVLNMDIGQTERSALWVELNPHHLQHNIMEARKRVLKDVKLMAIMKGNAYGHGVSELVSALNASDIDRVGVYRTDEAISLLDAGITRPIQQLAYADSDELFLLLQRGVIPTVSTMAQLDDLARIKRQLKSEITVHVRVDVSNGAIGISPSAVEEAVERLQEIPGLRVEGIFTHLPSNYSGSHDAVAVELKRFNAVVERIRGKMGNEAPALIHAGSSPSLYGFCDAHFNMVRVGTWLYGLPSLESCSSSFLKPVMAIKSQIADIKTISKEDRYLYSSVESYEDEKMIGIVTIGYADISFLFHYSGGDVLVNGQRVKVLGRPNMSHLTIDLTKLDAAIGDEVTLIGTDKSEEITFEEVADYIGYSVVYCERLGLISPSIRRVTRE